MQRRSRIKKIQRLKTGLSPRVLDLFSGCGGLSLGFQLHGFEIVANIEIDPLAAASHHLNFHGSLEKATAEGLSRDITLIDPHELVRQSVPGTPVEDAIDTVIGGPPCQAFARVGRAKLREVHDHPTAFKQDPRGNLYLRYLEYVKQLQPLAIVMENVPDVMNYGGHNIPEETCDVLSGLGYKCGYTLLNAVYFGVPQTRERMFLVALAEELEAEISFPKPTHWFELPKGYESSRQVALKHVFNGNSHPHQLSIPVIASSYFVQPLKPSPNQKAVVTAESALSDLPPITSHLTGELRRGARHLDEYTAYRRVEPTDYARQMRTWKGFESDGGVFDHTIRSLSSRDFEIFRRMKPGDQYPEAHRIALQIFEELLAQEPTLPMEGSQRYHELLRSIVPPYDPGKFPNKWRKMAANEPARTLMAHLGKDSYSHIHYDSRQARTISVREAARLMSFPDGFRFVGTMNPAFRQIGNAVPPLMAAAVAKVLKSALTSFNATANCA